MATYQSPLAVIVKGALAGAAGTAALTAFLQRAPELMERAGLESRRPPAPPDDPDSPGSPTEEAADRVSGGRLDPGAQAAAGEAIHWGYGAAWGGYFAVIQSTFRPPTLLHGLWLGGLMTAVAARFVPALGLAPAPRNRDELIANAAGHAVFGVVTAVVYRILNLGRAG